jgi:hypothetical protein
MLRRTSLPNDAPHVAAKHPAAEITVAMGVTAPEGVTTSSEFHRRRTSSPSSRMFAMLRRTSLPNDAPHVAVKHPAVEHTVAMGVTVPEGMTTSSQLVVCYTSSSASLCSRCPEGCRSLREHLASPRDTLQRGSTGVCLPTRRQVHILQRAAHRTSLRRVGERPRPRRTSSASATTHVSMRRPAAGLAVATGVYQPEGEHTSSQRDPTAARRRRDRPFFTPKGASVPATPHVSAKCPAAGST